MNVRFTPEAQTQADDIDAWWRRHRKDARDLFARELADAKVLLEANPNLGLVYAVLDGEPIRKVLLPRTRHHVYYSCNLEENTIVIHAVWGAPRGRGPDL
jgi:plasmid stabilization system protein ParE